MNDIYEIVGGVLYETPADETSALIDSPNFVAAKALVDDLLAIADEYSDIEPVFDKHKPSQTLINYINSPLVDALYKVYIEKVSLYNMIPGIKTFNVIRFFIDRKIYDIEVLKLMLSYVASTGTVEEYKYVYEALNSSLNVNEIMIVIKEAISKNNIAIIRHICDSTNAIRNQELIRCILHSLTYHTDSFDLLYSEYEKQGGDKATTISLMGLCISLMADLAPVNVKMFDHIMEVYDVRSTMRNGSYDKIYRAAIKSYNAEFMNHLYEKGYLQGTTYPFITDTINKVNYYQVDGRYNYNQKVDLPYHESWLIFLEKINLASINYDRILLLSLNRSNIEVINFILDNRRDKLKCDLECFAARAVCSPCMKGLIKLIELGVDVNCDNGVLLKMAKSDSMIEFLMSHT